MMNPRSAHIAYVALLAWMTAVGLTYERLSAGLASPTETGPFYCRELFSSGSDDDAMVGAFILFALPLLLRLLRYRRPVAIYEIILLGLCIAVTCFALFLASLDCAAIFYTAFLAPDIMLATALLAMPAAIYAATSLRTMQRRDRLA